MKKIINRMVIKGIDKAKLKKLSILKLFEAEIILKGIDKVNSFPSYNVFRNHTEILAFIKSEIKIK